MDPSMVRNIPEAEQHEENVTKLIVKCINFAAVKHKDQRRKDPEGTPYINHPIGVAYILTNEGNVTDTDVIQAALLHDTVEDTDTSLAEIESVFGARVCAIVAEVTDDKSLPKAERKRQQVAHAAHASRGAKLVKLADKLYNVRDLARATPAGWDAARVAEYVAWAERVVRGLRGVNAPMERALDEAFAAAGVEVAKGSPGE